MIKFLIYAFGLLFFLGACVPTEVTIPATVVVTRIAVVASATFTPTALATATPQPSTTPIPSPTRLPTKTATPTASPMVTATAVFANKPSAFAHSPDGQWEAMMQIGEFSDQSKVHRFFVRHISGEPTWWIEDISLDPNFWPVFEDFVPFHWSVDGRYLYFTHTRFTDGCDPGGNATGFQQLDLQTGVITRIPTQGGNWFAFSPDSQQLAYLNESTLFILDVFSGEERQITLDVVSQERNYDPSDITWSPDGRYLLFVTTGDTCIISTASQRIIRVDAQTLLQTIVIPETNNGYDISDWPALDKVILMAWNPETGMRDAQTQLNPFTGELQKIP